VVLAMNVTEALPGRVLYSLGRAAPFTLAGLPWVEVASV
jgi:hypothetical protein